MTGPQQILSTSDSTPPRLTSTFRQSVMLGIESVVKHHLQNGESVNARDDKGQTPLILAASKGHEIHLVFDAQGGYPLY